MSHRFRGDMIEKITVKLTCCDELSEVTFDDRECPAIAPQEARKNVTCPNCGSFLILSLEREGSLRHISQEIIELKHLSR